MKTLIRVGFAFLLFAQLSLIASAQSGIISTYAGPGLPVNGSLAIDNAIGGPSAVVSDGDGGFYIAVSSENRIYRVTADGRISLTAGMGTPGFSGDGGPAIAARLSRPSGVAMDSFGNLFISDSDNNRIRRVTPAGFISTIAGNDEADSLGDNGPATSAQLNHPLGIAVDAEDNLLIADSYNNRIRGVNLLTGQISTVAGNGTQGFSGDEGSEDELSALSAQLNHPTDVAVDEAGNLFIADTVNQRIRKVDIYSQISTVAGIGTPGFSGDGGQATSAELHDPAGVAVDTEGSIFIADSYNYCIRKVTPNGGISTVAGNGFPGFTGDGGPAIEAQLYRPAGLAMDAAGSLLIADYVNRRIREITPDGIISTVAGLGMQGYSGDGNLATSAQFYLPTDAAPDEAGNLFIADSHNSRIRKVTTDGVINTVAGNGNRGFSGDGGQATSAELNNPAGVALDMEGNLFIADTYNFRIRKVTPDGGISTVAGNGTAGFGGDGGPAIEAQLYQPWSVAADIDGNLFIADLVNHRIRRVTPDGVIGTVAGMGSAGFSGDGGPATSAQLKYPMGVAADAMGNLFIADSGNHNVRKVTPEGIISTVAGNGLPGFTGDGGPAASAQLSRPTDVAIDADGNLFITDHDNNRIRKVTPDGMISTVAGVGTAGFSGDGGPAVSAQLNYPMGIAVDAAENLFIADYDNHRIRKVTSEHSITSFFPQVVVGAGYSTLFTIANTGSVAASGTLIVKDLGGNPLTVKASLADSNGIVQSVSLGSTFPFSVPAHSVVFLSAACLTGELSLQVGWGQLDSPSGSVTGVATVQLLEQYTTAGHDEYYPLTETIRLKRSKRSFRTLLQ